MVMYTRVIVTCIFLVMNSGLATLWIVVVVVWLLYTVVEFKVHSFAWRWT